MRKAGETYEAAYAPTAAAALVGQHDAETDVVLAHRFPAHFLISSLRATTRHAMGARSARCAAVYTGLRTYRR